MYIIRVVLRIKRNKKVSANINSMHLAGWGKLYVKFILKRQDYDLKK